MPIKIDTRPGRKPLRKNGEEVGPIKPPGGPDAPAPVLRVRMLRDLDCKLGAFLKGRSYELPPTTARSWIGFGFAEQDKSIDSAPETK